MKKTLISSIAVGYMNRLVFGCILFLTIAGSFKGVYARNKAIDSLWNVWQNVAETDSVRLKALYDYAWNGYLFSQPDSAIYFAQVHHDYAKERGMKRQMAQALIIQGNASILKGEYDRALNLYETSEKINEEIGNLRGVADCIGNISLVYMYRGDYPKSLEHQLKGLKIHEELDNKNGIISCLINIGNVHMHLGDYSGSLPFFERSLLLTDEIGDQSNQAITLGNIGIIYRHQTDLELALDYCQRSLKMREQLGEKNGVALMLGEIGTIFDLQGDPEKALEYHQRCLKIEEEFGNRQGMATALFNIGEVHKTEERFDDALKYLKQSLSVSKEIGFKNGVSNALNQIGELYLIRGQNEDAVEWCQKGLALADSISALGSQTDASKCLCQAYKAMGKWQQALQYLELYQGFMDSLKADETDKQLQQFEFDRKVLRDSLSREEEKRSIELAHQQEIHRKNNLQYAAIGSGLLILLLAGGLYSRLRYTNRTKKVIETEKERSENLLLNILPAEIAEELKQKGEANARDFDEVSILFTDFKKFTETAAKLPAAELVAEINECFKAFDMICEKYEVEKIKTIGDAYMAAGGLPVPNKKSTLNTTKAALEMTAFMIDRKKQHDAEGKIGFDMRVGIHTGQVVAGIVGLKKFQYDIWGDAVNTAARMESYGTIGRVNISNTTYELLQQETGFAFEEREKVAVKGKGEMKMWFVEELPSG